MIAISERKSERKSKKVLTLVEYRRVSTPSQKEKCTIRRQEILNSKFLEYNINRFKVEKRFIDDGRSGFKNSEIERPNYNNMLTYVQNNDEIDGFLALKVDRLGRDTKELIDFKYKIKELERCIVLAESGLVLWFDTPMDDLIFDIQAGISNYVGQSIINKMQFMRKIAYEEHPEIFGRPKKEVPEKLKNKMIHWYKIQKEGFHRISKLIQTENIKNYPDWFQREYIGFGKTTEKEKGDGKKRFYLSPVTIGERLKDWNIKIRKPKYLGEREIVPNR